MNLDNSPNLEGIRMFSNYLTPRSLFLVMLQIVTPCILYIYRYKEMEVLNVTTIIGVLKRSLRSLDTDYDILTILLYSCFKLIIQSKNSQIRILQ